MPEETPPTESELALEALESMVPYASAPALTTDEVAAVLARNVLAVRYDADATSYPPGTVVAPPVDNGHWYISVANTQDDSADGSTAYVPAGIDQTDWPIPPFRFPAGGDTVDDGTVTWQWYSPAGDSLWDMRAAARECWLLKAGKSAGCVDASDGGASVKSSQMYAACMQMADRFAPIGAI